MGSVKDRLRQMIEDLPDQATWDDVMYQVYVQQKISEGRAAGARGETTSHEDIKKSYLKDPE